MNWKLILPAAMLFWCFSFKLLTHGCRGPALLTGFHIKETELPQCICWVRIIWRARPARATAAPVAAWASRWGPFESYLRRFNVKIYQFLLFYGKHVRSIREYWKNLLWICCRCTCTSLAHNLASLLVNLITATLMSVSRQLPHHWEHILQILNTNSTF